MSSASHRTLIVLRHARAADFAATDHERPLTEPGREQARAVGAWAAAEGLLPDAAIVSSAVRTQQTWEGLASAAGLDIAPVVDGAVYAGDTDTVLECVRAVDPSARTVLVVGHNPTMATLVLELDDGHGDADLLVQVSGGYPPSSAAVLTVVGAWADLDVAGATLSALRLAR